MSLYLATKLRNDIARANPGMNLQYHLRNIIINGSKRGCSGFVVNADNGMCVYVNTEKLSYHPWGELVMYRYAKDTHDYSSNCLGVRGRNRWTSEKNLAANIIQLLQGKEGVSCW